MYHYVRDLQHTRYPDIKGLDLNLFIGQIEYLEKYYQFITIQEMIHSFESGDPLPEKAVLLTFDDNYSDHYRYVFPVLDEKGIQGCFYSPVRAIQESKVLDVNKIHFVLASVKDKDRVVKSIFRELDTARSEYNLESNDFYYQRFARQSRYDTEQVIFIKRILQKGLSKELRSKITDNLFKEFFGVQEEVFSRELYMNPEQIRCMIRHGMHFGIHGYNHDWLDTLSYNDQEEEIKKSKQFLLEQGIPENEITVCYPYGAYNQDTLEILKKTGCQLAFTVEPTVADITEHKRFEIPRLDTNDLPKDRDVAPNKWWALG